MIGLIDSWDVEYNGTENEARFQLVCDSASELSSLTHYDNIKIRIGSECTDIATGDKYLKSSTTWVLQPSANVWENVYTKAQVDSMYNQLYQTMLYYHTAQESNGGTITFYAFEGFVGSLTIYGNGQQSGTPSPQNIVPFDGTGKRTGNLFDYTRTEGIIDDSYIRKSDGAIVTDADYYISYPIYVTENATYTWRFDSSATHSAPTVGFYDALDNMIGIASHGNGLTHFSFTTPNGCNYIRASVYRVKNLQREAMLNSGSTALPYEPYGYKIPITCAGQTVPVYLGQTQTVRRIKKLVLDGTETSWEEGSPSLLILTLSDVLNGSGITSCMCSHYNAVPNIEGEYSSLSNGCCSVRYNRLQIWFRDASVGGIDNFKSDLAAQYAAGNPVTLWYILAEPETAIVNEPLYRIGDYCDELSLTSATVSIPITDGENTLSIDTDLPPSKIEISGTVCD